MTSHCTVLRIMFSVESKFKKGMSIKSILQIQYLKWDLSLFAHQHVSVNYFEQNLSKSALHLPISY